ncbi:MAG: acnA [Rickettsiaceae bacterium]|jgi:aconitate hydratase|nr:acnA [Rickettsiaceae bacterium]
MTSTLDIKKSLTVNGKTYRYFSLEDAAKKLNKDISKLPFSLKILLENLLRFEDGEVVKLDDIKALIDSVNDENKRVEIAFSPSRVLMQDFTGVPAVVDLAAMRDAIKKAGGDPKKINPLVPVDLVIDHSVQVDFFGNKDAVGKNVALEMERNNERYQFLKWGQQSFNNFRVVPPGTGICHQVNLENLAKVVWTKEENGEVTAYPDTVVGTDSHTTMINGLAVLGWGVGGIEAEAAMLGQPISMLIPEVIGFKLSGVLNEGVTATDLVLTITNILRKKGVVGKFVEFFGPGIANLPLANRATIANMAPEYGATCGIFPIDHETLSYLRLTGRSEQEIALVEAYAKAQTMFADSNSVEPSFSEILELNLSDVKPSIAGPKRPQDKVLLEDAPKSFSDLAIENKIENIGKRFPLSELNSDIGNGDVVIAAITSCTNTSNPAVLIAAGLVAKKAVEKGMKVKKFVKTSFAPGSQVASQYLINSGLQKYLDDIGFNVVGYGCTTCIGNSGPLHDQIEETIKANNLLVGAVLSGNRNFEGRVHPLTKANYLASPPLVVAYALAGNFNLNLTKDAIGTASDGKPVYLKDIWPSDEEVNGVINSFVSREIFAKKYADLFLGDESWQKIKITKSDIYNWDQNSTYIRLPSFFEQSSSGELSDIKNARILAVFGDSITTDHISPAGNIASNSPAAAYLKSHNVEKQDFNSYGARRGNHEVMMRGTFANIRIKNEILEGVEGGYAKTSPAGEQLSIYDAAMEYKNKNVPLVIFAGKEYGTGSSRDWAAKGTLLLGVKAVIAESFERIHRSNLVGMGILPLIFKNGETRKSLGLTGFETVEIIGIENGIKPKQDLKCIITRTDGSKSETTLLCRIDTKNEVEYYKAGGILQFMTKQI